MHGRTDITKKPRVFAGFWMSYDLRASSIWWAHQDSNLEPKDYESSALTIEL